jgi:hypothetical protein
VAIAVLFGGVLSTMDLHESSLNDVWVLRISAKSLLEGPGLELHFVNPIIGPPQGPFALSSNSSSGNKKIICFIQGLKPDWPYAIEAPHSSGHQAIERDGRIYIFGGCNEKHADLDKCRVNYPFVTILQTSGFQPQVIMY